MTTTLSGTLGKFTLLDSQNMKLDCHKQDTHENTCLCVRGRAVCTHFLFIILCRWVFISPALCVYASSF